MGDDEIKLIWEVNSSILELGGGKFGVGRWEIWVKLGSIRDRMCATAKIALNPVIIAFQ